MITIKQAKKTYKNKRNKTVAIDNTTLSFGRNGLVVLLGPSGCGKTTMLNCIGGLEKINSGQIFIDDERISKRTARKIDKIRNRHIGYIFQDYKLIDNFTVFDNIALVLKMIGMKDKYEIKRRVEKVLENVNMSRYKMRPCSMLSGGERQRVAIARALVKNPDIILADEPTGNLDNKNSLEVMKIISQISKEKLVILVTHDMNLANFYADRIINIADGQVRGDILNNKSDVLHHNIDGSIYLEDFERCHQLKNDFFDINIYRNENERLAFDLVMKDGNIYIRSNSRIEIVDENSNINLINGSYKQIIQSDLKDGTFESIPFKKNFKIKNASIFNIFSLLKESFSKVVNYPILKKLLLLGIFASAILITISFSMYAKSTIIDESDYLKYQKDFIIVESKALNSQDYASIKNLEGVNYALPLDSAQRLDFYSKNWYQMSNIPLSIEASISLITENIDESTLLEGTMPQNDNEILLDAMAIDKTLSEPSMKSAGIFDYKDFIGTEFWGKYKVTGITSTTNPSIYIMPNSTVDISKYITTNADPLVTNYVEAKDLKLSSGVNPLNFNETIVNKNLSYEYKLGSSIKINNEKFKIVGFYESDTLNDYLVNIDTLEAFIATNNERLSINCSDNKTIVLDQLKTLGFKGKDAHELSKKEYLDSRKETNKTLLILCLIVAIVSFLIIFLISRSSFLSRIKEVGVYRAIGIKKSDIYKMFIGETVAIYTLVSIPGIALAFYTLSSIEQLEPFVLTTLPVLLISVIVIFAFMIIVSAIPVFNTIKKAPAFILSRTDAD